jgi:hypothetical protein
MKARGKGETRLSGPLPRALATLWQAMPSPWNSVGQKPAAKNPAAGNFSKDLQNG